jgi:prepilin-type N-terminal cleavage/methylation domain-containing protein/prepilin-type processing-associated H-X9-DG protein
MTIRRARGFTLIELLVVIAIIGILAAMLFPVFARARESARKIQCLSNIKNIALAMQMYLTDYDKGLPREHRQEVIDTFDQQWGGGTVFDVGDCHIGRLHANPYLRPPVILDEYIKNRDVWRCPSAKMEGGAMFIYGWADWFAELQAYEGVWGNGTGLCPKDGSYPNGWGGSVTDSLVQGRQANTYFGDAGRGATDRAFIQSVAMNDALIEVSTSAIGDPASTVICGDAGACVDFMSPGLLAYPDLCAMECGNCWGWADWENCGSYCDFVYSIAPANGSVLGDPNVKKQYTRHLGGSNIGFMDGHAKWYTAEGFIAAFAEAAKKGDGRQGMGMWMWGASSTCCSSCGGFVNNSGGQPVLY